MSPSADAENEWYRKAQAKQQEELKRKIQLQATAGEKNTSILAVMLKAVDLLTRSRMNKKKVEKDAKKKDDPGEEVFFELSCAHHHDGGSH